MLISSASHLLTLPLHFAQFSIFFGLSLTDNLSRSLPPAPAPASLLLCLLVCLPSGTSLLLLLLSSDWFLLSQAQTNTDCCCIFHYQQQQQLFFFFSTVFILLSPWKSQRHPVPAQSVFNSLISNWNYKAVQAVGAGEIGAEREGEIWQLQRSHCSTSGYAVYIPVTHSLHSLYQFSSALSLSFTHSSRLHLSRFLCLHMRAIHWHLLH